MEVLIGKSLISMTPCLITGGEYQLPQTSIGVFVRQPMAFNMAIEHPPINGVEWEILYQLWMLQQAMSDCRRV